MKIIDVNILSNNNKEWNPELFNYLSINQKKYSYRIGSNARPDPYIYFIEWNQENNKILLFYSFNDDEYMVQRGAAVYNLTTENFERIIPYKPFDGDHPPIESQLILNGNIPILAFYTLD